MIAKYLMWLIGTNDALTFNCTHCFFSKSFVFPILGSRALVSVHKPLHVACACLITSLPSVCFHVFLIGSDLDWWNQDFVCPHTVQWHHSLTIIKHSTPEPDQVYPFFKIHCDRFFFAVVCRTRNWWTSETRRNREHDSCKTTRCEPLRFFLRFFARALSLVCSDESMYTSFMKAFHHLKTRIIWKIL